MPQLPAAVLRATFYLYASVEDAKQGKEFGGTGFLIGFPSAVEGTDFGYAITNWHVAVRDGFSVIRVNKLDGGIDIFEHDPSEWSFIPSGPDVAAIPFGIDRKVHDVDAISSSSLMTRERAKELSIGVGEDVFMVGRFVDHDGGESNIPAARFGNISIMPTLIKQPTGGMSESYVLDMHSRTGYSGSAVYVYRTPGQDLSKTNQIVVGGKNQFISLLGIHWGQFPELWQVKEKKENRTSKEGTDQESFLSASRNYIEGMSGMSLAVPAWNILEVLEVEELKKIRTDSDSHLLKQRSSSSPVAESAAADGNARSVPTTAT